MFSFRVRGLETLRCEQKRTEGTEREQIRVHAVLYL